MSTLIPGPGSLSHWIEKRGIFAFSYRDKEILAADCDELSFNPDGLWYRPSNKRNVIHVVERWIFVPYHSISAIALNEKPL